MKKLMPLGMLVFLLCCNNTDTTIKTHDLDATDVDDTAIIPPAIRDSAEIAIDSFVNQDQ